MGGDRRADRVKIDIGKETEPKMITDLLEVHLDGVGTICFTKSNGARIRKDFGSAFFFDGSTIHGNLFVNIKEGNGIYSVQFVEIETQISVTTILSDMMGNAAAIHAIQVGWGEFRKIYSHPRECQWYTQVQPRRRTFRREQEGLCDRSTKGVRTKSQERQAVIINAWSRLCN